jgi:integrase
VGDRNGLITNETNPVLLVPKAIENGPRERVLTDAELALIWRCTAHGGDYDCIVRLLLMTAARRDEVGAMEWSEFGNGPPAVWTLPAGRSKNGVPHEVPLGPLALAQLPARRPGNRFVFSGPETRFSGWSQSKARLDRRMQKAMEENFLTVHGRPARPGEVSLPHWTLHDLRRTFSTWANETGIEPHIVEACLNHVSGAARRGVAGIYNKARYRAQKSAVLAVWEAYIRGLVGAPALTASVLPLRKPS